MAPHGHNFLKELGYKRKSANRTNNEHKKITDDISGSEPGFLASLYICTPAKFSINAKSTGAILPIF